MKKYKKKHRGPMHRRESGLLFPENSPVISEGWD